MSDRSGPGRGWVSRDVLAITLSACTADLGYQAIIAGLPLLLVVELHAGTVVFALATAIGYGGGALLAVAGGRLGDRFGHRRVALLGNAGIPLLGLIGLAVAPWQVVLLFALGWWARNFRNPSRRALLVTAVAPVHRGRAFGLLNALDLGGGLCSTLGLAGLLAIGWSLRGVFLLALAPLVLSTVVLALAHPQAARTSSPDRPSGPPAPAAEATRQTERGTLRAILVATGLFGFSFYNVGFPILTVAQGAHALRAGVIAYAIFLGSAAVAGIVVAGRRWRAVPVLAILGYGLSAVATCSLGVASALHGGAMALDTVIAVLGAAVGIIETVEPTMVSALVPAGSQGRGLGLLTGSRSAGLLVGNLVMGVLYLRGPLAAYLYAAAVAAIGAGLLLTAGRQLPLRIADQP